jgi:hypothetical protein
MPRTGAISAARGRRRRAISRRLALTDPEHLVALHLTQLLHVSLDPAEADQSDPADQRSLQQVQRYQYVLGGYGILQDRSSPTTTDQQPLGIGHLDQRSPHDAHRPHNDLCAIDEDLRAVLMLQRRVHPTL